jgi:hypothetical protein
MPDPRLTFDAIVLPMTRVLICTMVCRCKPYPNFEANNCRWAVTSGKARGAPKAGAVHVARAASANSQSRNVVYCFSSFVMVFTPPISVAVKTT